MPSATAVKCNQGLITFADSYASLYPHGLAVSRRPWRRDTVCRGRQRMRRIRTQPLRPERRDGR